MKENSFVVEQQRLSERLNFVLTQVEARGVRDRLVLEAMRAVPRELFVPEALRSEAYQDYPLAIGSGQTISQPFIVAFMIEALRLRGSEKVLEIGAGSGYAAAVLSKIADDVFAIERIKELAQFAIANLKAANCERVRVRGGDGSKGWEEEAPFDAILISAAAPELPRDLLRQLKIGGRMIVPVGEIEDTQKLMRLVRTSDDDFTSEALADVRFVPLIGRSN